MSESALLAPAHFDGVTYDPTQDRERLQTQLWRVYRLMRDGGWRTLFEIYRAVGGSEAGVSTADVPAAADVVFVGGSTEWKWASMPSWCGNFQRVHVGRVNTYRRLWACRDAGAESCDGTGWFRGDQKQYRDLVAYLEESSGMRERVSQMEMIA